ncbi:lipoprotein N-acyltransferase Lnb domain-containing protein [Paraburkholderia dilworthii]|uniref:lipoprotein N-acyltransferase Lnb domain-containing protein n=1 Tax=Paraburkholderia dilworthii TaxID=948106 RepID=UPI003898D7BE
MHRDSWGYVLRVTATEKQIMLSEIKKRMTDNRLYSVTDNSCSSNLAEILLAAGIQAYDPRFEIMDVISPADLMVGLKHSRRLVRENVYPKK